MIPFPMPGVTRWDDNIPYTIVASDHYTDVTAICLAIVPSAPHFVVIHVGLETGKIVTISARAANIGTAVAYYAEWGGTVNDIDPYPARGIEIRPMKAYVARFMPQAWVRDNAIGVDALGETEWDCTEAFRQLPESYRGRLESEMAEVGEGLDGDDVLKHDANAPEWVREWSGPFSIYVRVATRDEIPA